MIAVDRNKCPHDHRCPLMDICPEGAISQGADGHLFMQIPHSMHKL